MITLGNHFYEFGLCSDYFIILYYNPSTYSYYTNCCIMACYYGNNDANELT